MEIPFTFLVDFSSTPACFGTINRRDSYYPSGTLSIYKLTPKGGSLRVIVNSDYSTSTYYSVFAIGLWAIRFTFLYSINKSFG